MSMDGRMPLLQAVADGRVTRDPHGGFWAPYILDGDRISPMYLRALVAEGWILMHMAGPPQITADGRTRLRRPQI